MLVSVYPPLEPRLVFRRKIRTREFPYSEDGCVTTHLGRGAIWLGLQALGLGSGDRLAMPAFHCGSEVEAARVLGIEIEFYRVSPDLEVDTEHMAEVASRSNAVYLISHFGFPTVFDEAATTGKPVFEDVAHGLFSLTPGGKPLGCCADATVFCPRKSLGVPDGGLLLVRSPRAGIAQPKRRTGTWRSVVSLAVGRIAQSRVGPIATAGEWGMRRASATERAAEAGTMTETVIGEWNLTKADLEAAASPSSKATEYLACRYDPEELRARRRRNYKAVTEAAGELVLPAFRELPDGTCPLYVPVRTGRREAVLRRLWADGIRAIEIWPVAHPLLEGFPELRTARSELVALPVHQGLAAEEAADVARRAAIAISRESE